MSESVSAGLDPHLLNQGWLPRDIFWSEQIYQLELERIFARAWVFIAHESQLPQAGSFLTTRIGEDEVIVVRNRDGRVGAFLNSCPHRGNRVCSAEVGVARGFVCNYHGWSFGLDGALRGMHESGAYDREPGFDRSRVGLTPVAQVEGYKGLLFATFDPSAPPLTEFLGDFTFYLDVMLDNDPGGTEFAGGCISSILGCNWKIAAENFAGDALHAGWTHASGAEAMLGGPVATLGDEANESYHVNVNGHCWEFNLDGVGNATTLGDKRIVNYLREQRAAFEARLGPTRAKMVGSVSSATIFPNFSFLPGQNTFRTWQPLGPHKTELRTWVLVNRNAPQEVKDAWKKGAMLTFSPSGVFEMDDGENWEGSTHSNRGFVTRQQPLHYGLGLHSRVDHPELPGHVYRGQINDANQRAFYRQWSKMLNATDWDELLDKGPRDDTDR
ncbi:aromatic ring-hydroxylating oxygenase subunit alpha [Nocardia tengchongensis]|uniref:aromatic ring-hydroxylating oxygenase subunit alpha n=1 Tax=Nocardia tengchongensis TaxID=2055889 RepID=UPI0036077E96